MGQLRLGRSCCADRPSEGCKNEQPRAEWRGAVIAPWNVNSWVRVEVVLTYVV